MPRTFAVIGSTLAGLGVAAGAFGAHSLKALLTPDLQAVFETAVRYQLYHAFGLFVAAWSATQHSCRAFLVAGWLFVAGIVLFSGSLYALSLSGLRWLGAVTPLGGLAFMAGWMALAYGWLKKQD